jgi:DNA polymerase-3 subunit gamma/tau
MPVRPTQTRIGERLEASGVGWGPVADTSVPPEEPAADAGAAPVDDGPVSSHALPGAARPAGAPVGGLPEGQPYQALYRRYRPQRFADVRGQEHVTRALRNAVREERVAHAYLFSGPRGTGKTSTARILAMALNCESPDDGEPDGTCTSCTSVRSGASMDVFELDAASNRKLDEMRDLLSRVALGTPGRWKVYIIDEVHQLTADAASALLKTLEEPPSHVVFVLATTDPQKVLPTILSRTQHFEFHLLDGDLLTGLLDDINADAGLGLTPNAVRLAVERGRGSARDAESALEQLAAAGEGEEDSAPVAELAEALAQRDVSLTLQAVARAVSAGKEPRRLGNELVEHLRNAFLAQQAPSLVLLPAAGTAALSELGRAMGLPFLVRSMETVGQALVDMRDSVDPRVTLEVALIRLSSPAMDATPASILERIDRLEHRLQERAAAMPAQARPEGLPLVAAQAVPPSPGPASAPAASSGAPPSPPRDRPVAEPSATSPSATSPSATSPSATSPSATSPSATDPSGAGPAAPNQRPTTSPATASPGNSGAAGAGVAATPASGGAPVTGAAQARAALGAFLRPGATAGGPAAGVARPGGSPGPQAPPVGAPSAGRGAPRPGTPAGGTLPTRDEITKAWGDTVLGMLSRPAQVYMAGGRFTEVSNGVAVFALPDRGLMERATNFVAEAEKGLGDHFGRPVPLRLVVDTGASAPRTPAEPPAEEGTYDLDDVRDLTDAPEVPVVPVEQRILEAFPGSVLDS